MSEPFHEQLARVGAELMERHDAELDQSLLRLSIAGIRIVRDPNLRPHEIRVHVGEYAYERFKRLAGA